jgi:hypothetical protein
MPHRRIIGEHFKHDGRPKRRYPTRAAALKNLPKNQHAYLCDFCAGWHRATGDE